MSDNNNLQQQIPESKPITKQNSYTYWVDEKNKSRQLPPEQRPQKIEAPLINQNKPTQNGRSHWNTAGTWQHKTVSLKQIQKQYQQNIMQWILKNSFDINIKKVSLNGQCQVVFIRNKKVLTYQINGKVEFQKNNKDNQNQNDKSEENQSNQAKQQDSSSSQQNNKNKKSNKKTLTFEIVDFTDSGDRQYKCKAQDNNDKIFISSKASQLTKILENIIQKYK